MLHLVKKRLTDLKDKNAVDQCVWGAKCNSTMCVSSGAVFIFQIKREKMICLGVCWTERSISQPSSSRVALGAKAKVVNQKHFKSVPEVCCESGISLPF